MESQIKIRSDIKNFCEVENFIKRIYLQENFNRKIFCRIYISVTEAVNNAIKHGNGMDNEKFIEICFIKRPNEYEFVISDQGKGFNYLEIPDPTKKENLNKESGRGIFLMKKYSDKVIFKNQGSIVTLLFDR
jgi:serine/threonine-protein kinase RsbW